MLTGRYLEIEMLPFSLSETLDFCGINASDVLPGQEAEARIVYEEYLRLGGYPETFQARQMTGNYLLSNFCNPFTTISLSEDLGMGSERSLKR